MSEFLSMWKHAIQDYRRNMKRGFSLSTLKARAHSYALGRQTARGVGPGTQKPVKEEATMDIGVTSEPPLKRPKGPGMSADRQIDY
eukprot:15439287-Alexandrium_andersonii.AAC.1